METYQMLYHTLVQKMDAALTCLENGQCIKAYEIMQTALLDAEDQIIGEENVPESAQ